MVWGVRVNGRFQVHWPKSGQCNSVGRLPAIYEKDVVSNNTKGRDVFLCPLTS